MSLLQVLAADPFSFVTPSCGGAVDGYLQWCTTFVRTVQGTYGALAQSLIRSRSNKQPDSSLIQLTQNYYRAHGDSVPLTWLVCLLVV